MGRPVDFSRSTFSWYFWNADVPVHRTNNDLREIPIVGLVTFCLKDPFSLLIESCEPLGWDSGPPWGLWLYTCGDVGQRVQHETSTWWGRINHFVSLISKDDWNQILVLKLERVLKVCSWGAEFTACRLLLPVICIQWSSENFSKFFFPLRLIF